MGVSYENDGPHFRFGLGIPGKIFPFFKERLSGKMVTLVVRKGLRVVMGRRVYKLDRCASVNARMRPT